MNLGSTASGKGIERILCEFPIATEWRIFSVGQYPATIAVRSSSVRRRIQCRVHLLEKVSINPVIAVKKQNTTTACLSQTRVAGGGCADGWPDQNFESWISVAVGSNNVGGPVG